jgi:hypothetical protein
MTVILMSRSRERLHVANNWDGKDCLPHHSRLAAAISASAPPEAWTEDTAPCAVVAAETDFAFMERESREPGRTSRPGALSSGPAHAFRPNSRFQKRRHRLHPRWRPSRAACAQEVAVAARFEFRKMRCRC